MPSNITHMLIAHKALQKLKAKGIDEFTKFAEELDKISRKENYKAYINLGSLGPDLYYYTKFSSSFKDMLKDGFVQAKAITQWSYHLHTKKPNEFPLKLVEIVFSDVIRKNGKVLLYNNDIRRLAYIAGHLTHIAADQIIHPLINQVAGPCYRNGEIWKKHREFEIFQDYFLYEEVYRLEENSNPRYVFLKQAFYRWIDCVKGVPSTKEKFGYLLGRSVFLKWNIWSLMRYIIGYIRIANFKSTEEWFRYFLQRGFVETYGSFPSEEEIKDSIDYLRLTLLACQKFGPYRRADKKYRKEKDASAMCQEYIKKINYMRYYRLAVELAVIYLIALYEVYFILKEGYSFTNLHKKRFLSIVSDADLSCPLKQNIYEKALAALRNKSSMETVVRNHIVGLLTKTKFLSTNLIFKTGNDRDIVKA